ncbi:MAG TPA: ComF family protein [Candidatus Aminicenantes bacterium]|nr:ComF family protein [Candidatus Aminicenantes bacterium]
MTGPVRAGARALAKLAELLVFPSSCRLCGALLERPGERIVCRDCLGRLSPRRGPACPACGRFFEGEAGDRLCGRCLAGRPAFSAHRSCAAYGGPLKDVILLFKYRRCAPLAVPLARFAEAALGGEAALWEGADALVPVPLHRARRRERGFNQALLLARELGRRRGLEVLRGSLVKVRNVAAQAGLRAAERERNVVGAYAVRRREKVRGRVLVLVDDVTTTGATLRECARALAEAGAKDVRALTLAQAL